jgi:hypothetical protein
LSLFYHHSLPGKPLLCLCCFFILVSYGWLDASSLIFDFLVWSGLWRIPKERGFQFIRFIELT